MCIIDKIRTKIGRYVLLLISAVLFVSCVPNTMEVSDGDIQAKRFEYDGHQYIQFSCGVNFVSEDCYVGYVHDPDCPCNKGNNQYK